MGCMRKAKLAAVTWGGTADEIETQFYEALQTGDMARLMACWADDDEIVCVHPGGARLTGSSTIRAAFDAMFANGSLKVHAQRVRSIESLASVVHSVIECIEFMGEQGPATAYLIATNVYHKTPQGWRMVVHHASPGTTQDLQELDASAPVLH
jgi:uncharacterized protein (TIGR02246 family)